MKIWSQTVISLHLDKKARAAKPGISCEDGVNEISVFTLVDG